MSKLSIEGSAITSDLTGVNSELPQGFIRTKFIFDVATTLAGGDIQVREQSINNGLNPDVASIVARTNTPVQKNEGDNKITEMLLRTTDDVPIGIILLSPDGKILFDIWDPKTQKGLPGFIIDKGWTMQMIVPQGCALEFLDYWSPRGFCDPASDGKMYGETVLLEVAEADLPPEFIEARNALRIVVQKIANSRR